MGDNEFFRKASLLILSSAELEAILERFHHFIQEFIPVDEIYADVFESETYTRHYLAKASHSGGEKMDLSIRIPPDVVEQCARNLEIKERGVLIHNHGPDESESWAFEAFGLNKKWKQGWSTDYVATRIAKRLKAKVVINLSNIDYVYDKDPNKHKDAEVICDISWKDFRAMVGNEWDPGMSAPFDPVASRLAHHSGIRVGILNGKNMENLDNLLKGKRFLGTVIGG